MLIGLVPIFFENSSILDFIKIAVQKETAAETNILNIPIDPEFAFNPSRDQYNSTLILAKLLDIIPKDYHKIIGIISLDLYIPVLTYVFGEAQLNGKAATVSSYRLHNEFYGMPADNQLFMDRLLKETVHELGHTYGLIHCHNPDCVMHPSTYVEEIDLKTYHYCTFCKNSMIK